MIGCGAVARRHAQWLAAESQRARIALCCDPQRAAAAALRDELAPGAAIETDAARALASADLDAVILCSPTAQHYEQACRALERGLHVVCEKPLAARREQILDLIERQRASGRVLCIPHQRRYRAVYRTARRELTRGRDAYGPLGEIHVYACERWQQTIAGTWRDDPAAHAGYFGDAGLHHIDVVYFITGLRAERVLAHSDQRGSRVEIVTRVIAELTGGVGLVAHFVGNAQHWREDLHFHGARRDLLLRSADPLNGELYRAQDNRVERIGDFEPDSNPDRAFLDAVLGGVPTDSPPEVALPVHDWVEAVMQSVREGGWVELPRC